MVSGFDRIIISVTDLQGAADVYGRLLGVTPLASTMARGMPAMWLGLPNVAIELVEAGLADAGEAETLARISGLVFRDPAVAQSTPINNARGLDLALDNGSRGDQFRAANPGAVSAELKVDHLVLYTADADDCVELFSQRLGIRLALDKTVPAWGGRMVFLRSGKLTLEIIEPQPEPIPRDYFWGIAYQCADIDRAADALAGRGIELSAIREGRKPGTRVATLRSNCLGIPSLLLEAASST